MMFGGVSRGAIGRAFSALRFRSVLYLGRCPRLVWGAPLALVVAV